MPNPSYDTIQARYSLAICSRNPHIVIDVYDRTKILPSPENLEAIMEMHKEIQKLFDRMSTSGEGITETGYLDLYQTFIFNIV